MSDDGANIFISHIHEDDDHIAGLKNLLAAREFTVRDSSINSTRPNKAKDPDYIKREILAPAIDWAGTVVVLVSPDTKDSAFVQWEIEYAAKHDKRIIGVFTPGSTTSDLPEGLADFGDGTVVSWNGDAILDAIRGKDVWQDSDGKARDRVDIQRHNC